MKRLAPGWTGLLVAIAAGAGIASRPPKTTWSMAERQAMAELSLDHLPPLPRDPTNRVADDLRAVALGKALFFDARFSANGKVSCARGTWLFWDGRKDSQWSQALGPWESPVEHGGTRAPALSRQAVHRVFANMGKAVAAYERHLEYGPSRFDRYVRAVFADEGSPEQLFTGDEVAGLRLFLGKARCTSCHSGPLLSDGQFHNIGVPERDGAPADSGRLAGVRQVLADEFNCRSAYSDAPDQCDELAYAVTSGDSLLGAVKTPSLRNVAERAPYMHRGQFATLEEVLDHYDRAEPAGRGHSELVALHLTATERRQLLAFLRTLSGGVREKRDDKGER